MSSKEGPAQGARRQESCGAALVEYGMVAGLIAVISIGAVVATGDEVKTAFCSAANSLASEVHGKQVEGCLVDDSRPVTLDSDEHYVEAEPEMVADFADKLYANAETGARVVMAGIPGGAPASFWIDAEISSRNAHEPNRTIAACYLLAQGVDPICSVDDQTSAIEVPAGAQGFGYMVSLSDDTAMPWANDVALSTPGAEGVAQQNWAIEVARQDAPPNWDIAFDFPDLTFEMTDAGWLSTGFVPITGDRNVSVFLQSPYVDTSAYRREICYRMEAGGAETCDRAANVVGRALIELPPGAAEVALNVYFGDPRIGSDSISTSPVTAHQINTSGEPALTLHEDVVTLTRPNTPKSWDIAFDLPDLTFETTDTGWLSTGFVPITGDRNVPIFLHSPYVDTSAYQREICYRMVAGGEETCDRAASAVKAATLELPVGAAELALNVYFGDERIGNDSVSTAPFMARQINSQGGLGATLLEDEVTMIRQNTPIMRNVAFDLPDLTFETTDTGWLSTGFVPITGERNVSVWLQSPYVNTSAYQREICYRMEAGGEETCARAGNSVKAASIELPVGAAEVALNVNFGDERISNNDSVSSSPVLVHGTSSLGWTVFEEEVTLTRKNTPITRNIAFELPDTTFAATDEDWLSTGYVPITGERNVSVWLKAANVSATKYREICYRMEAGGEATCATSGGAGGYVALELPPGAAEVALSVKFPAVGTNSVYAAAITVHGTASLGWTVLEDEVTLTRPAP